MARMGDEVLDRMEQDNRLAARHSPAGLKYPGYSLDDIVRMRAVIYGGEVVVDQASTMAFEMILQTYMGAGVRPEELEALSAEDKAIDDERRDMGMGSA